MARLPTRVCRACGRDYEPDARNDYHQTCCTRPRCVRDRKQQRQRLWYREKYAADASFQEKAKARVFRQRQGKAEARVQGWSPSAAESRLRQVEHALLGLAAQIGEEPDAMRARQLVSAWAETGRRRGVSMPCGP